MTARERKLRFLFDIYDMDGDGVISNGELYSVGGAQQSYKLSWKCPLLSTNKMCLRC